MNSLMPECTQGPFKGVTAVRKWMVWMVVKLTIADVKLCGHTKGRVNGSQLGYQSLVFLTTFFLPLAEECFFYGLSSGFPKMDIGYKLPCWSKANAMKYLFKLLYNDKALEDLFVFYRCYLLPIFLSEIQGGLYNVNQCSANLISND